MHTKRCLPVQLAFLASAAAVLTGCPFIFTGQPGPYMVQHDHPLREDAVAATAISGRTITFADGRSFDLAGVSVDNLTPEQKQKAKYIQQLKNE